jgi:hypothetical protein
MTKGQKYNDLLARIKLLDAKIKDANEIRKFAVTLPDESLKGIDERISEFRKEKHNLVKEKDNLLMEIEEKYGLKYVDVMQDLYADSGESGVNIWIFRKLENEVTEKDALNYLEDVLNVCTEKISINSPYDCTGKRFCSDAETKEANGYIIVTQSWGYDV